MFISQKILSLRGLAQAPSLCEVLSAYSWRWSLYFWHLRSCLHHPFHFLYKYWACSLYFGRERERDTFDTTLCPLLVEQCLAHSFCPGNPEVNVTEGLLQDSCLLGFLMSHSSHSMGVTLGLVFWDGTSLWHPSWPGTHDFRLTLGWLLFTCLYSGCLATSQLHCPSWSL